MRWEIISTQLQQADARKRRNRIESLLLRMYAYALKLYPSAFRAAFADEMLAVFAMTLRETIGASGLMQVVWRELLDLPLSLIVVHQQTHAKLSPLARRMWHIRWFVHLAGGALSLFLLLTLRVILSPSYNLYTQAVPFVVALFLACASMLLALRWGRIGGLLTIASGAAIGCCMSLYLYVMAVAEIGMLATVLIGLIWALPFLIFGLLFYELSKQSKCPITAACVMQ